MRTVLPRIAFLALPLVLLAMSACSGHHRFHHDRDAWHDQADDRGYSVDRYDRRNSSNGWDQDNGRGRYNGGKWFRW